MRHRAAFLWFGLSLTAAFLLLCSCDEVEHHRMLSFFFDGVPPLPGEANEPGFADTTAAQAAGGSPTGGWHVHKPISNCTDCHGSRRQRTSSRQVQLVAEVPKLCHGCHREYAALPGWVHGPVAVGECLLCHEPHKARNEFLLVKPVPELCFDCHESQAIRLIEGHARDSYARCHDCHEGHVGATKNLLKPALLKGLAGPLLLPGVRPGSGAPHAEAQSAPAVAPRAAGAGNERRQMTPADRYNHSVQAYHAGRFAEAREGFLEVIENRSAPQSMREMAEDYLGKIEWLQKEPQLPAWRPAR